MFYLHNFDFQVMCFLYLSVQLACHPFYFVAIVEAVFDWMHAISSFRQ